MYTSGMDTTIGTAEGIFLVAYMGIFIAIYLAMIGLGITGYILDAIGMYRIAQRRGIHRPWLAWIPVANSWLLGSISDQYQYVAKQKVTKRRRILLILEIITIAGVFLVIGLCVAAILNMETEATAAGIGALVGMLFSAIMLEGVAIAVMVFAYMAYFDLFRSCRPQNEVLFLILGIFIPVTLPFFVFACSKSDLGMPPRQEPQPPAQIPCGEKADAPAVSETEEN